MSRTLVPRYLATLELSTATDSEMHDLAADVALAAKTSPVVLASATIQASVALLATKDAALTASNDAVAADRTKLHIDIGAEAVARSAILGELRSYATLVTNAAKSYADIHAAGLPPAGPSVRGTLPTVPAVINNKPPKTGHGKTTVSVYETGPIHYQYAAEQSLDGINWSALGVGFGKTRVITGASGTKVWVRFAMVRGQLISDWSTPIMVTIP